ncbi:MAG: lysine--tRNA ligase [Candidatus Neptunochlamydia sp.]|nr:lysine--tRNA ligase [Candidatus Neptunochlamydia sp.]
MDFYIEPSVIKKYPDLKIGILIVRGIKNRGNMDEILHLVATTSETVKKSYEGKEITQDPKILDWREAYKSFGYKPSSYRCSAEALIRRVIDDKGLPTINPVVNLYNLISIKYGLPAGAYDLDKVGGTIRLAMAKGNERFTPLGLPEEDIAKEGEIIYRDDEKVLCKGWNWRQSDTSKITEESQNIFLPIDGLEHTKPGEITKALHELKTLLHKYCGGQIEVYYLDHEISKVCEESKVENRQIAIDIPEPDYHSHKSFQTRKQKLKEIRALGVDPYPHKYEPTYQMRALQDKFEGTPVGTSEEAEEGKTDHARIAGRLVLFRAMGKNAFGQIQDETKRIQVMFNRDQTKVKGLAVDEVPIKFIEKKIDLGDIIGVEGHLFRTQKGELTIFAKEVTLLCKTLLPLPDKHSGLTDKGTRYRKRWLDLITNPESVKRLRTRSFLVSKIRKYFEEAGFMEVETPVLQNIYGGAEAQPFISELKALHQTIYLRIAIEISLKKLIVGGFSRVFEIGKVYRNEGLDRTHNPEFTMLESYAAYWDYNDVMTFTENLFAYLAKELYGTTEIGMQKDKQGNEHLIDLKTPWKRLSMKDAICEYGQIHPDKLSDNDMRSKLKGKIEEKKLEDAPRGKLISYLFEEFAEHHLIQPHHIIDHPIETTPLCKLHRDPKLREEKFVERFETFILGYEFCNAYSELNDPELQRQLLEEQNQMREEGDDEANPMDEEFIEAICQGMPPTGGFGIGIDRLTMLFTDAFSIRDVVYFPMMRPGE